MLTSGIFVSIIATYICLMAGAYQHDHVRIDFLDAVAGGIKMITKNPLYFWPIAPEAVVPTLGIVCIVICVMYLSYLLQRVRLHHDVNTLKGSSKWADLKEMLLKYAEFEDEKKQNYKHAFYNAICSENFQMSMNQKKHFHALNTLILGTTGTGKSRYYLKPNLLQLNCSYVITDPSGGILQSCGETLRRFGYNVRVFDLVDMGNCNTYNPMKYCKKESDVKALVEAFVKNTMPPGQSGSSADPFWDNAMNAFLCATVSLLVNYGHNPDIMGGYIYEPCFSNLCELTRMANKKAAGGPNTVRNGDGNTASGSELNIIFERVRADYESKGEDKPYCLQEWENFKIAPEKTSTTILMTAAVRLDPFNIQQVKELTTTDTIDLDTFGDGRDALFVITPTNDATYNYLVSFMYTQLFNILYTKGEKENLGTIDLKLQNGELVKHFTKAEVDAGIEDAVKNIQNATIHRVEVNGKQKVKADRKKKKKKHLPDYIYDEYYDILAADGTLISRRPDKALAEEYVAALKDLKRQKGNGESLPSHVRFLLDEFANTCEIPLFKEKLATMRKYEISCTVICQSITQLKGKYEKDFEVVDGNCPVTIFLGGDENSNNEYVSKKLGSSTVKGYNASVGQKQSISSSFNVEERILMKPEELGRLPFDDMITMVYGEQPIYDKKFDYPNHKNYKYTYDFAHGDAGVEAFKFDRSCFPSLEKIKLRYEAAKVTCTPTINEFNEEEFQKIFMAPDTETAFKKMEENNPKWVFDAVAV